MIVMKIIVGMYKCMAIEAEHKHLATKAELIEAVSEVKISIERLENKLWKYLLVVAIPSIISTAIGIAILIFNILQP